MTHFPQYLRSIYFGPFLPPHLSHGFPVQPIYSPQWSVRRKVWRRRWWNIGAGLSEIQAASMFSENGPPSNCAVSSDKHSTGQGVTPSAGDERHDLKGHIERVRVDRRPQSLGQSTEDPGTAAVTSSRAGLRRDQVSTEHSGPPCDTPGDTSRGYPFRSVTVSHPCDTSIFIKSVCDQGL
jgi:hypothetical protein